jgi:hypothetical protein
MVPSHHFLDSFSILGMLLGTLLAPVVVLATLFTVVRAVLGN